MAVVGSYLNRMLNIGCVPRSSEGLKNLDERTTELEKKVEELSGNSIQNLVEIQNIADEALFKAVSAE